MSLIPTNPLPANYLNTALINAFKTGGADFTTAQDGQGLKITNNTTGGYLEIGAGGFIVSPDGTTTFTIDPTNLTALAPNPLPNELCVNNTLIVQNDDTTPTEEIQLQAGDNGVVGELFGINYNSATDQDFLIQTTNDNTGGVIFKQIGLGSTTTQTKINQGTIASSDTSTTASTTITPTSIAMVNPPSDITGSYSGNAFNITTDATGSSVGTSAVYASAINSGGTLQSSLSGSIVGMPSPPYPAPDANFSLSVNSTTNNPALYLSKSAPFTNSTSMTIDLNNITHNQSTGSVSPDDNFTISTNKNLILTADNIDLSDTGRMIIPSLASTNYMDYNTGKLTIVNNSVAGSANPLLVLQNNNNTAGATTFETYKNDLPTSTGGDTIASWSATCNTNIGKTETSRVNHIAYGVGASNNDGGISLACKVNSTISTFLTCNGGVGSGEIQVFKTITTTSPNNLNLACPTAGGAISLTSASNINLEATGDNLTMTAGSAVLIETTGTGASIEFKPESSAGDLIFTGANIESSSSGANSGQHLRIKLNGVYYKIKLENDT